MKKQNSYIESVHFSGRVWGLAAAFIILLFPVIVALLFRALPDPYGLLQGLLGVAPLFWTVGIIEVFTYVPMLGAGGSYLSFVTGNLTNLKVPCALNAMDKAGVSPTSEEGEVISTIAIAVSSIVTTLVIALGVALIVPLTPVLENPVLTPAFDNVLPALFGALGVVYISKNWKIAIAPVCLMLLLFFFVPYLNAGLVGIMVPVGVLFATGVSRIMYNKGMLGKHGHEESEQASDNSEAQKLAEELEQLTQDPEEQE